MNTIELELNPNHLWLKIAPEIDRQSEEAADKCFNNFNRAYLNLLAQKIILPYLKEDFPNAQIIRSQNQFIELGMDGTIISIGGKKLALILSESYGIDELRVDREWVDIPELAADYFLAVQVDKEEKMMRAWGYATHKELKETGTYTERDRTYSLDRVQLSEEINALWLIIEHFPKEVILGKIDDVIELSESCLIESANLLDNSEIIFPRRFIDFEKWSRLICKKKWRDTLIKRRFFDSKIREIQEKELTSAELTEIIAKSEKIYSSEPKYKQVVKIENCLEEMRGTKEKASTSIDRSSLNKAKEEDFGLRQVAEDLLDKLKEILSDNKPKLTIAYLYEVLESQGKDLTSKLEELQQQFNLILVGTSLSAATKSISEDSTKQTSQVYFEKELNIAGGKYELRIIPINIEDNVWTFELHNAEQGGTIPIGFKLRLLDESGNEFENNEIVAEERQEFLQLRDLKFEAGEEIIWEIEPTPDDD